MHIGETEVRLMAVGELRDRNPSSSMSWRAVSTWTLSWTAAKLCHDSVDNAAIAAGRHMENP